MSKDSRHDGRRRGGGQQHRLGLRSAPGGDGRDRSGSNSSGSSHGGGKGRNTPISIALKVTCHETVAFWGIIGVVEDENESVVFPDCQGWSGFNVTHL